MRGRRIFLPLRTPQAWGTLNTHSRAWHELAARGAHGSFEMIILASTAMQPSA